MYKETVEGIGKEHDVIENVYWCMLIMCVWKACVWQSCLWKNCVWESCVWQSCVWHCCEWHCCVCDIAVCEGIVLQFCVWKIEGTPLLSLSATHTCHPNVPWRTPSATLATQKCRDRGLSAAAATSFHAPNLIWVRMPRVLMKFISMRIYHVSPKRLIGKTYALVGCGFTWFLHEII